MDNSNDLEFDFSMIDDDYDVIVMMVVIVMMSYYVIESERQ